MASPTYERLVTRTLKDSPDRTATLWGLECAIRRMKGRTDTTRLVSALDSLMDSGRIERMATGKTGTTYRMARSR